MARFEDGLSYHPLGSRLLALQRPALVGTDVKVLQTLFNQLVAITHPPLGPVGTPIAVDGVFGPQTRGAVRNLQSYFGLAVDGVAGAETYRALGQLTDGFVTYGGPVFGSRTLAQGSSGGDVKVLQNRLNLFRYASALGSPADGVYGPATGQAVAQFRSDALSNGDTGLAVDDTLTPAATDAVWIYTYTGGRNLSQGTAGLDVAFLQLLLANLTNPGTGRPYYTGAVDGYFGPVTAAAVKTFQGVAGISADGIAGPITYYQLGVHHPVAAPRPAPIPPV